jgi:hypothetical protein
MLVGGVRPYARFFIQLKKYQSLKSKTKELKEGFWEWENLITGEMWLP